MHADGHRLRSKSVTVLNPLTYGEMNINEIIEEYVAVWNESDPGERRRRIRSVWAEGGRTCYRLSDAHGYEEIERRVTGSWEKWLRDGKYIFKPEKAACHHDVVRFNFVMVTVPEGRIQGQGLSFLTLDANGHIRADVQFNPTATEAEDFAERYLAVLNEQDAIARRKRVIELWAPDATYITAESVRYGHTDLVIGLREFYDSHATPEFPFVSAKQSHAHHNFVTFRWQAKNKRAGSPAFEWSSLALLDESGRIRTACQFQESS